MSYSDAATVRATFERNVFHRSMLPSVRELLAGAQNQIATDEGGLVLCRLLRSLAVLPNIGIMLRSDGIRRGLHHGVIDTQGQTSFRAANRYQGISAFTLGLAHSLDVTD